VGEQHLAFGRSKPGQRRFYRRPFLLLDQLVHWPLRRVVSGEQMGHAASALITAYQGNHQVARRHHGVRRECVTLDAGAGRQDARERLLDDVVDEVRITDTGCHDAADERDQVDDRLLTRLGSRASIIHANLRSGSHWWLEAVYADPPS
jgi:hypothetical protein